MKTISTQLLSLMLCLELVLAPFPKTAAAETTSKFPDPVTSPSAYLKAVQAEAEALFDPKSGCATLDDEGVAHVVNSTTQEEIHGTAGSKGSIDCKARVEAFGPLWAKAKDIVKQYEQADKSGKNGSQCADCKTNAKILNTDFIVPKEGLCSLKEKKQIKADYADPKKKCGWASNLSPGSCLDDILFTFKSSMISMTKTAISGAKSVGNWLIKSHSQPEKHGTAKSLVLSGMDSESIKKAQEDGEKATRGFVEKMFDGLGAFVEFVGIDYPAYKETFLCAKCGERADAICKMVGILGKDVVKNSLIIWAAGKPFQLAAKTGAGKAFVAWGEKTFAKVGEKAVIGWTAFERAAPYAAKLAKFGGKVIVKTFEVTDKVMTFPLKLAVSGGEKVAASRVGMKIRSKLFKQTPGLKVAENAIKDEAEVTGLKTVEEVSNHPDPLVIESGRPETPPMAAAKKEVGQMKSLKTGKKIDVAGIENATESKFEVAGSAVKVETKNGPQYFNVGGKPEAVREVYPFGPESKSAIIRIDNGTKEGALVIAEDGRLANYVKKGDVKKVEALLGSEQAKSDQLLLKQTEENAKLNGIEMKEEVASNVPGEKGKASFKTGDDCGNKTIMISAGRAF